MPHEATMIGTLAAGFVLAFALGYLARRLRLPPLVGYLLAGIVIGPFTPGIVADSAVASQLAEMGVILLMFGVGLHFSAADLMAVRWIAIPGAIGQILVATAVGALMAWAWGWSVGAAIIFGLSLSVASTVVLLRALEDRNGRRRHPMAASPSAGSSSRISPWSWPSFCFRRIHRGNAASRRAHRCVVRRYLALPLLHHIGQESRRLWPSHLLVGPRVRPLGLGARRAHGLARTLYAFSAGDIGRHRLRLSADLRRVIRAWRLFCRLDH